MRCARDAHPSGIIWIKSPQVKSEWKTPEDVKKAHPKASIIKSGRVVFNIKANDYRLIALVQYVHGVVMIRFSGSHEEYDKVDAEAV
ncbi:MAG TPA: type II toxin-antitoxin system HigB family toxin [Steroidobacteraceae bacterium]